jgi:general secretion pathway protein J
MAASMPTRRAAGFTLVEVMVALLIMAILAGLAFRGMEALVHAKDAALSSTDRTLKLNTGMSQFEYDVSQVVDTKVLHPPIMFDGATLRLARRTPDGVQLVLWTLQDRRWQRWASGSFTHMSELSDAWMRSQQWDSISAGAITVLENVDGFQYYVCNPNSTATSGCSWNNGQSTQGTTTVVNGSGSNDASTTQSVLVQPTGIRITLKVGDGEITRERELPRW